MSLVEVVDDLLALEDLAEQESDPDRRRSLDLVRTHLVDRDLGAKVSEVALLLGLSHPTVRAWMSVGVLQTRGGAAPARVSVVSLAEVKRAVDLLREHHQDRDLLVGVMRHLRDRSVLAIDGVEGGFEDIAAGRVAPLSDDLLEELTVPSVRKRLSGSS